MALTLADKGAHVILACRNEEKAESAKSRMLKTSPNANITVQILDLAGPCQHRTFCEPNEEISQTSRYSDQQRRCHDSAKVGYKRWV